MRLAKLLWIHPHGEMKTAGHFALLGGLVWIFLLQYVTQVSVVAQQYQQTVHGDDGTTTDDLNGSTIKCCNQTMGQTHQVEVEFTTSVVQNEYIVRFNGYYLPQAREKYLKAALNRSQVGLISASVVYFPMFLFRTTPTTNSIEMFFDVSGGGLANSAPSESSQ